MTTNNSSELSSDLILQQAIEIPNPIQNMVKNHPSFFFNKLGDFLFHKITFSFALSVLLVLLGIIISLSLGAWPALQEFGLAFITTVEWDPVNDQYGALIAIVGTLTTSFKATVGDSSRITSGCT
jgi:ABC-type phosphate transport system permease subunit